MSKNWEDKKKDSVRDFRRVGAPVLERWSDGRNVSVEAVTDGEMAAELDQTAGVDSWNVKRDDTIRGVASRVQYIETSKLDEPPGTFTIRKSVPSGAKTEFQKRLDAIRKDALYPVWTVQAYLDRPNGQLLEIGRVKTKDLIEHINDGSEGDGDFSVADPPGKASFYVVKWWKLESLGIGVRYEKPYKSEKGVAVKMDSDQTGLGDFVTDGAGGR